MLLFYSKKNIFEITRDTSLIFAFAICILCMDRQNSKYSEDTFVKGDHTMSVFSEFIETTQEDENAQQVISVMRIIELIQNEYKDVVVENICVVSQIVMDNTKLMPGRVMVILVCLGVILGAIGIYKPFLKFAGAGASVPLTGFGYNLWMGVKNGIDEDGLIGLFRGGFTMASVGTSAALIFSYIASLIFQPKMSK